MVKEFADGAIKFYQSGEITEETIFGYDDQMKAALGLSLYSIEESDIVVLILGYPGTGKSVIPKALAWKLNNSLNQNFSLLTVDCDSIVGEDVEKQLDKALKLAAKYLPTIISFDEFEGIAVPIQTVGQTEIPGILSRKIRRYAGERNIRKETLLLCISNFPNKIDWSTIRNVHAVIYFNTNEEPAIASMLDAHLGIKNPKKIANLVIEKKKKIGFATLGHNVIEACKRIDKKKLKKLKDSEIVRAILCMGGPGASLDHIEEYEKNNKYWINWWNDMTRKWWIEWYNEFTKKNKNQTPAQ